MFEALIKVNLFVAGCYQSATTRLHERVQARRQEDGGLATLEWVALTIVAVGLAIAAGIPLLALVRQKISEIP